MAPYFNARAAIQKFLPSFALALALVGLGLARPNRSQPYVCEHFTINLASDPWSRLAALDACGPALARRIVSAREHGLGGDAQDALALVPGVGPALLRRWLPDLVVRPALTAGPGRTRSPPPSPMPR